MQNARIDERGSSNRSVPYGDVAAIEGLLKKKAKALARGAPGQHDFPAEWNLRLAWGANGPDFQKVFSTAAALAPQEKPVGADLLRQAQENMVRLQLHHNGVTDEAVLNAFRAVPRDIFIPGKGGCTSAYADTHAYTGQNRYAMEPRLLGKLLQEAGITNDKSVLEVACGTGYATAVISQLAGHVTAIDCKGHSALAAREHLHHLGCYNTSVLIYDLADPDALNEQYDVVFINGAVSRVPDNVAALVKEGGVLLAVERLENSPLSVGRARFYKKTGDSLSGRTLFSAQVPMIPEFDFGHPFMETFKEKG